MQKKDYDYNALIKNIEDREILNKNQGGDIYGK